MTDKLYSYNNLQKIQDDSTIFKKVKSLFQIMVFDYF